MKNFTSKIFGIFLFIFAIFLTGCDSESTSDLNDPNRYYFTTTTTTAITEITTDEEKTESTTSTTTTPTTKNVTSTTSTTTTTTVPTTTKVTTTTSKVTTPTTTTTTTVKETTTPKVTTSTTKATTTTTKATTTKVTTTTKVVNTNLPFMDEMIFIAPKRESYCGEASGISNYYIKNVIIRDKSNNSNVSVTYTNNSVTIYCEEEVNFYLDVKWYNDELGKYHTTTTYVEAMIY